MRMGEWCVSSFSDHVRTHMGHICGFPIWILTVDHLINMTGLSQASTSENATPYLSGIPVDLITPSSAHNGTPSQQQ